MKRMFSISALLLLSFFVLISCNKKEKDIDETPVVIPPVVEVPYVLTAPSCLLGKTVNDSSYYIVINSDTVRYLTGDTLLYDGQKRLIRKFGNNSASSYVYSGSQIMQYDTLISKSGNTLAFRSISDINSKGYKTRTEYFTPTDHYFENYTYDAKDFLVRVIRQNPSNVNLSGKFHEIVNNNRVSTWFINFDGSGNLIDSSKRVNYVYDNKISSLNLMNAWINRLGRPNTNVEYITRDTVGNFNISRTEWLDANGNPYQIATSNDKYVYTTKCYWKCQ